ncbi:PREDICTED: protein FAR1-RELATED SEQUENCE 5-like [Ipomoea nil]|uniref:protein FAR1-RELATED SEQUENCE 5-like n=1 Tax=Ipomoea nil TaxID=35883 RepID=UPI0009015135|nr:PREDICTED: protein FAR1-RELATED SEQUENCE 5-like [Ipomoea nil]
MLAVVGGGTTVPGGIRLDSEGQGLLGVRSESLQGCVMDVSPDGTKFWTPSCDEAVKPFEGQTFPSLAYGIDFYRQYASLVGFDIFVLKCARANVGPNRSFRLAREFAGSYSNVGATCVDFKNLKRDLMAFIGTSDAHIVVKKYAKKVDDCPEYVFKYDVDSQDQLCRAFWADLIAKENFSAFGEVVSFDATYGTSRYGMVLVPFTGVDNHKRGVTFAMGFISREDVDSYVWLLQQFKSAMGCVHSCTITDHDPSMQIAVPQVFDTTRHRFCMWHIMSKVGEKVGNVLSKDEEFRRALNDVVWCETLSVEEFERGWQDVMEKYSLGDHRWFRLMYDLRSFWIPAFFNDLFMGGLLRMTSRSEAANSAKLNPECEGHFPLCQTPLLIEKHTVAVYTVNVFYDVQAEVIAGSFSCRSVRSNVEGLVTRYEVQDGDEPVRTVSFDSGNAVVECTCNMFSRVELLCRHIFWVFKDRRIVSIPSRYVIARWTRGACVRQLLGVQRGGALEVDVAIGEAWAEFFSCVTMASRSVDNVTKLNAALKDFNVFLLAENGPSVRASSSKKQL